MLSTNQDSGRGWGMSSPPPPPTTINFPTGQTQVHYVLILSINGHQRQD